MKKQRSDKRTLLEFCREHGLPFTNEDKLMYSIQNSRKYHKIFKSFMERDVEMLGNEQDQFSLAPSLQEIMQQVQQQFPKKESKFKDEKIAFNQYGELNMELTEDEMVKYYFAALEDKFEVPERKERPKKGVSNEKEKDAKQADALKDENGCDIVLSQIDENNSDIESFDLSSQGGDLTIKSKMKSKNDKKLSSFKLH